MEGISIRGLVAALNEGQDLKLMLPISKVRTLRNYAYELGTCQGRKITVVTDRLAGKFIEGQLVFPVTVTREN